MSPLLSSSAARTPNGSSMRFAANIYDLASYLRIEERELASRLGAPATA